DLMHTFGLCSQIFTKTQPLSKLDEISNTRLQNPKSLSPLGAICELGSTIGAVEEVDINSLNSKEILIYELLPLYFKFANMPNFFHSLCLHFISNMTFYCQIFNSIYKINKAFTFSCRSEQQIAIFFKEKKKI
ncbi:hypothetical protein ACJX0J_020822, partial [Zea mays]